MRHGPIPAEIPGMGFSQRLRRAPREPQPSESERTLSAASTIDRSIVEQCVQYSMTGVLRLLALIDGVRYCVHRGVAGSFAECGVWRGGSVLAMILTLQDLGVNDRDIYLYDTFEGMTEPSELDTSHLETPALDQWRDAERRKVRAWNQLFDARAFNEQSVQSLLAATGYPTGRLHFVKGPIEETVPGRAPDRLALLRLDTDWYESTHHELIHLFPRLEPGGVLIVDDYGHWQGAQQAVDEYFATKHAPLLLSRIDYTGRIAVKQ